MWNFLLAFIPRAIVQGIPLLYGSTGEIITEKSGNLNLGIPGVMYVGAISGVIGSFFYERSAGSAAAMNPVLAVLIPVLCCLLGSLLMGLLYCRHLGREGHYQDYGVIRCHLWTGRIAVSRRYQPYSNNYHSRWSGIYRSSGVLDVQVQSAGHGIFQFPDYFHGSWSQ